MANVDYGMTHFCVICTISLSLGQAILPMSSDQPLSAVFPRAAPRGGALAVLSVALLLAPLAEAATLGKTYFFATREACAASEVFTALECAGAFANARLQLHDLAPKFASSGACRQRFRLCAETRSEPEDGGAFSDSAEMSVAFMPIALGVEIVATPAGAAAAPTLAADTPAGLFPYFPTSRRYAARRFETAQPKENAAILAPDHFEPFSKRKPFDGPLPFTASTLGVIVGSTNDEPPSESAEERRARLKAAPFVQ
jgi:hypothetical protein